MQTIAIESDTLHTGWTVFTARIPPRVCGAPNTAATERVRQLVASVNPAAYDPLPEAVAEAVVRDAEYVFRQSSEPVLTVPPNCIGCIAEVRTPRASFPPFVDPEREDDTGEAIPGYPPGVACNVTGGCE